MMLFSREIDSVAECDGISIADVLNVKLVLSRKMMINNVRCSRHPHNFDDYLYSLFPRHTIYHY